MMPQKYVKWKKFQYVLIFVNQKIMIHIAKDVLYSQEQGKNIL